MEISESPVEDPQSTQHTHTAETENSHTTCHTQDTRSLFLSLSRPEIYYCVFCPFVFTFPRPTPRASPHIEALTQNPAKPPNFDSLKLHNEWNSLWHQQPGG